MKTLTQIQEELAQAGKPNSRFQLSIYMKRLNIQHIGPRQRPQKYPDDTADRVISHLNGMDAECPILSVAEIHKQSGMEENQ